MVIQLKPRLFAFPGVFSFFPVISDSQANRDDDDGDVYSFYWEKFINNFEVLSSVESEVIFFSNNIQR